MFLIDIGSRTTGKTCCEVNGMIGLIPQFMFVDVFNSSDELMRTPNQTNVYDLRRWPLKCRESPDETSSSDDSTYFEQYDPQF